MEIGIFGITANPVHLGHWEALRAASEQVDQLWVSPVYTHPFGKKFVEYPYRKAMLDLTLKDCPLDKVKIKEFDKEYFEKFNETVYSYKLLTYLKNKYPEHNFKLVIGEDNYKPETWTRFYKYQEIEKEFGLVILPDKGAHSTQIRQLLQNDQNIDNLVSKSVKEFIYQHNLYKEEDHVISGK